MGKNLKKRPDDRRGSKPGERRGGPQKGLTPGMAKTLKLLNDEKFRLPEDSTEGQQSLAAQAREIIARVMLNPGRNATSQLLAARTLLEEACGKVEDNLKIKEHQVTVNVVQSAKPVPLRPAIELPNKPELPAKE